MIGTTIRTRLTVWYGLLTAVTITGLGIGGLILVERSLLRRVDAMLDFEFAEAAERTLEGRSTEGLDNAPAAFHETYLLRLLFPDGRIESESPGLVGIPIKVPELRGSPGPSSHVSARLGSLGECRIVSGETVGGPERRIVQIATPLASFREEMAALRAALWMVLPAGLAAATLGGYWLAGRALAPVARMTAAAQRISAANLDERIGGSGPDELGRLAETINAMLDRIDRSFSAARRFTADASHELRTPLAAIRAEAEVVLMDPRPHEVCVETLQSIIVEAERLGRLADRLLLLSIQDAGGAALLNRRPFRAEEAVLAAVDHAAETSARAGVRIQVEDLPEMTMNGDRDLIRQVFDNLIENALKYTPPGGIVMIRGRVEEDRATIEVADSGIGIPATVLPRVFDRFYRVDASRSRKTGGTGLGLSIVRSVVERHGGTVEASSEPGRGSVFLVTLPLATADDR